MNEQWSQQANIKNSTDPKIQKNQQTPKNHKKTKKNQNKKKTTQQIHLTKKTKKTCFSDKEMLMWNSAMTPFLTRNDANQRTPRARSVSQIVSTRLLSSLQVHKGTKSQPATLLRKPQDSGPYQAGSTSTHVQSGAMRRVAQHRPNTFRTR